MTRQDVLDKLYERYIAPVKNKKERFVGIEIEMPIVNLNGKMVDFDIVHSLTSEFLNHFGFKAIGIDEKGNIYSAEKRENGDIFSYDCSYNNLELSFGKEKSIAVVYERFKEYYTFIEEYFKRYNYTLTGMGINPNRNVNKNVPIEIGRYKMLYNHLSSFVKYSDIPMYFHDHPNFGMFSSASQVQIDVSFDKLPKVINTFNKLEPIKALLFNNSVLLGENEQLLCCRDMLWENSTHGINPHNVGMYESEINTIEDILNYISTESIYCVERDGKYINFQPVNIIDYFSLDKISGEYIENGRKIPIDFSPEPEDLNYLRSFKLEDLTFRGTIEFRSGCCQPICDSMTIAAFHAGLMEQIDELETLISNDTVLYGHGYNAKELRNFFTTSEIPSSINEDKLYDLAKEIVDICRKGLLKRGFGEEKFISTLYNRIANRTNPAKYMLSQLKNGKNIYDIVCQYANI